MGFTANKLTDFFLLLKNFSFKRFSPEKDISEKREEENGEKSENIGRE